MDNGDSRPPFSVPFCHWDDDDDDDDGDDEPLGTPDLQLQP